MHAVIDYEKCKPKFWHDSTTLFIRGQEEVVQVKATQSTIIRPCHQTLIWAELNTLGKEDQEGHGEWQDDTVIIVARVLGKPNSSGQVPLRLMNPSNVPILVAKNSLVGSLWKVGGKMDVDLEKNYGE